MSKAAEEKTSIGGRIQQADQHPALALLGTFAGKTQFEQTRWNNAYAHTWILDCLNHGTQKQRVQEGRPFVRPSRLVALYAPGCRYYEWQESGAAVDEAYVLFTLAGSVEAEIASIVGKSGYCHFVDTNGLIKDRLRQIAETIFARRPGCALRAHGVLSCLLGDLLNSTSVGPRLRLSGDEQQSRGTDLRSRIESYVRRKIDSTPSVKELARHVGMSASAFAHLYPTVSGETPHRTVLRLKIEEAKRLLMEERLRVRETSDHLGFSSEFHFSKAFKRLEGLAPRDYRSALLNRLHAHNPAGAGAKGGLVGKETR